MRILPHERHGAGQHSCPAPLISGLPRRSGQWNIGLSLAAIIQRKES